MTVIRTILASFMLLLAACSSKPVEQPVVSTIEGKPALWTISAKDGTGGTAYLFGTVHSLPPGTKWQTPVLDKAINDANGLVLEVTGLEDSDAVAGIFTAMGARHGLPKLSARVTPDLRGKLAIAADRVAGPAYLLDGMETWAAALTIGAATSGDLGLDTNAGVEHILQMRFTSDSKPVSGLETITVQFGYFDNLPEADQRLILSDIVMGADQTRASYQMMLDAWLRGDSESLLDTANAGILGSPHVRSVLLDVRNQLWADQIAYMVDKHQRPFVAVGAGHMAGIGGVPALLAAKGYKVVRIQ
jgi:uncharacterized protein